MNPAIQTFKKAFSIFNSVAAYENDLVYTKVTYKPEDSVEEAKKIVEKYNLPLKVNYYSLFKTIHVFAPVGKPFYKPEKGQLV